MPGYFGLMEARVLFPPEAESRDEEAEVSQLAGRARPSAVCQRQFADPRKGVSVLESTASSNLTSGRRPKRQRNEQASSTLETLQRQQQQSPVQKTSKRGEESALLSILEAPPKAIPAAAKKHTGSQSQQISRIDNLQKEGILANLDNMPPPPQNKRSMAKNNDAVLPFQKARKPLGSMLMNLGASATKHAIQSQETKTNMPTTRSKNTMLGTGLMGFVQEASKQVSTHQHNNKKAQQMGSKSCCLEREPPSSHFGSRKQGTTTVSSSQTATNKSIQQQQPISSLVISSSTQEDRPIAAKIRFGPGKKGPKNNSRNTQSSAEQLAVSTLVSASAAEKNVQDEKPFKNIVTGRASKPINKTTKDKAASILEQLSRSKPNPNSAIVLKTSSPERYEMVLGAAKTSVLVSTTNALDTQPTAERYSKATLSTAQSNLSKISENTKPGSQANFLATSHPTEQKPFKSQQDSLNNKRQSTTVKRNNPQKQHQDVVSSLVDKETSFLKPSSGKETTNDTQMLNTRSFDDNKGVKITTI
jgi:hypothetical protein